MPKSKFIETGRSRPWRGLQKRSAQGRQQEVLEFSRQEDVKKIGDQTGVALWR